MSFIQPNWQVPANVRAFSSTRQGGVSLSPYHSFNLGDHVGDDQNAVKINRTLLVERGKLPQYPLFLTQTHSTNVLKLPYVTGTSLEADAVYTNQAKQVCAVMTADCLPLLVTNQQGNEVAAIHAGWRGLCDGIIENTIAHFQCSPTEIRVWLSAAIGPTAFQVGQEVVDQFCQHDANAIQAFVADPTEKNKYLANLYQLATQRLQRLGIQDISGGEHCTYREKDKFFSYRRDKTTGRMVSLIWFE